MVEKEKTKKTTKRKDLSNKMFLLVNRRMLVWRTGLEMFEQGLWPWLVLFILLTRRTTS